jgi:tyrosinase
MPDADIALPFWDECLAIGSNDDPIPWILTAPTFALDGDENNPLFSYALQQALADNHTTTDQHRYSKPQGYQTVRYPLSGLVGNIKDIAETKIHNSTYADPATNAKYLNANVKAWLEGTVQIQPDKDTPVPDTFSAAARYRICLDAPNYTVFSNKASMAQWIKEHGGQPHYGVALEEGHNAIHLALGGFYQKAQYNADPIRGANGDMGENETAGFDPIFYLHHAFVDYVFWTWQRRNGATARGSLTVDPSYNGTTSQGDPVFPKGTPLTPTSQLAPFRKPNGDFYTSDDVTDIENIEGPLAYTYARGSLDNLIPPLDGRLGEQPPTSPLLTVVHVDNISRADHMGSFVIRTLAQLPNGEEVEIGRDAVLSRWHVAGCSNCQGHLDEHSFIAIDEALLKALGLERKEDLKDKLRVHIQDRPGSIPNDGRLGAKEPNIEFL